MDICTMKGCEKQVSKKSIWLCEECRKDKIRRIKDNVAECREINKRLKELR